MGRTSGRRKASLSVREPITTDLGPESFHFVCLVCFVSPLRLNGSDLAVAIQSEDLMCPRNPPNTRKWKRRKCLHLVLPPEAATASAHEFCVFRLFRGHLILHLSSNRPSSPRLCAQTSDFRPPLFVIRTSSFPPHPIGHWSLSIGHFPLPSARRHSSFVILTSSFPTHPLVIGH